MAIGDPRSVFGVVSARAVTLKAEVCPPELLEAHRKYVAAYDYKFHGSSAEPKNFRLLEELGLADYMVRRFSLTGSESEVASAVRSLSDAGVTHLMADATGLDHDEAIQIYGALAQRLRAGSPLRAFEMVWNPKPTSGERFEADYVVVGAGSAGCVIAARLSESPNTSVLLVEGGGTNRHPYVSVPLAVANLLGNPRFDWMLTTVPQAALGGRALDYPRGKGLGGSSAINAMAFVRGSPSDYDGWAAAGCNGWEWKNVLPCFKRMEDYGGDGGFERGSHGPVRVAPTTYGTR